MAGGEVGVRREQSFSLQGLRVSSLPYQRVVALPQSWLLRARMRRNLQTATRTSFLTGNTFFTPHAEVRILSRQCMREQWTGAHPYKFCPLAPMSLTSTTICSI